VVLIALTVWELKKLNNLLNGKKQRIANDERQRKKYGNGERNRQWRVAEGRENLTP
jgi:hypothetical protein